jgi:DnaA family protein
VPVAPVYLWGPEGCGKSHLLHGLAARVADAGCPLGWFRAGDAVPWLLQPEWALVVIDDCGALDAAAQHAAFVLFTDAVTHGVPVAAAGRLPPADLPLRDDLRTRLAWGHVFALQPLSDADTGAAMAAEARRRGLDLPPEVSHYLLSRFPRDLGTMMTLLAALDSHGLATSRRLTVPLVRDLFSHER